MFLLIVIRSLLFLLSLKYKGVSKTFFYSGIATLGPVEALLPYTVDSFSFVNSVTLKLLLNFAFLYFRLWPSFACTLVVLLARVASYVYFNEVEVSGLLIMQVCCNLLGSAAIMILIHLAFSRLRRLITQTLTFEETNVNLMDLLDGVVYFRSKEEGHKLLFCNKEQKEEQHATNSKSKAKMSA